MLALALLGSSAAVPAQAQLYKDPRQPIEKRVEDLVSRMTLEEKAAEMQNAAPGIPRLGIPPYDWWNEALHGIARAGEATVFPQAIAMAATWDPALLLAEGQVIAVEGRAKYNQAQRERNYDRYYGLTFWSPNINIFRDPRWGRGQETLGEDPFLTGTLATRFIQGIQGEDPRYFHAIATPKHFAVHSGPEPLRHGFNVDPSPRDLWETYLAAFRRTITEGKAYSLMCAYNAVDGKPACANDMLLGQVLRGAWGFKGFVTSDCGAIDDVTSGHKYRKTNPEAAAITVKAGTDTGCDFKNEYLDLPKAVQAGLIGEAEIDVAVKRLFEARMRLGLFDPPSMVPWSSTPISENHSAAHRALALRAARESIVLLKNDGILPLGAKPGRIAVIGPNAASLIGLEGNYNGTPVGGVLPVDGIAAKFGAANVTYAQGSPFTPELALPVPRTAFGPGLKTEFFANTTLSGKPAAVRTSRAIDENWSGVAPAPGLDPNRYSVRWSGTIAVPAPGDYEFQVEGSRCNPKSNTEAFTLRIEGAEPFRIENGCRNPDAETGRTIKLHFADTRPRTIVLDYAHEARRNAPHVALSWKAPAGALRDEALTAAKDADVIVAFVGLNAWLEGEEMPIDIPGFRGGDRTEIALPKAQADLVEALEATGKPVVIVLQTGSAIALGEVGDKARAVLVGWYGGEAGGTALAEVLKGEVNPSGRLPVTFYKSAKDLPPFEDYAMAGRTYRYFGGNPEYAFGHGLSYTSFTYSNLKLGASTVAAGSELEVSVTVTNSGAQAGDEVAQLYLSTAGREGAPIRSLKGYDRVHLEPGKSAVVRFHLSPRDMALADKDGVMRIAPADYRLWVGGGQPGTGAPGAETGFRVMGSMALPK
ncbi:MAG: glycoside hydrolase family 3 C-terminal domain-containing protein [Sphingomonas sp.]|nr:glycoside hydrolase family 3 C-terminal domain-containing protein [Sphingomonas sp.]MBO9713260.1 glycoside hydrolase family 3 C-terminal domain-containing protein [Sphingomonas sp.]